MIKTTKKYETPTVDIIRLGAEDIITTSGGFDGEIDALSEADW